jgi:hypothetical protein
MGQPTAGLWQMGHYGREPFFNVAVTRVEKSSFGQYRRRNPTAGG